MTATLNNFDVHTFLQHYWQKKPCIIKQGFTQFVDPIDEHELAGLAQEEEIDSRLISHDNGNWHMQSGPIEDFAPLCVGEWTLLVQGVNKYLHETASIMQAFDFIPGWRLDDLMVSFSNEGGGVGAHEDEYDVFIVQGAGQRRWQVGHPQTTTALCPHPQLKQIEDFEPCIDEILNPGDIVYIPPKHPHKGVALSNCMNYSVGFRAPNQAELLTAFTDHVIEHEQLKTRYSDKNLSNNGESAALSQSQLQDFKALLLEAIDSSEFDMWLPQYLSNTAQSESPSYYECNYSQDEVLAMLPHTQLIKHPSVKPVYFEEQNAPYFSFFVEEKEFKVSYQIRGLVMEILNNPSFYAAKHPKCIESLEFLELLATLLNEGYWYLDEDTQ